MGSAQKMEKIIKLALALFAAMTAHGSQGGVNAPPPAGNSGTETLLFEADESIFPNPERGLYTHRQWTNATGNPLSVEELAGLREREGITLVLTIYYMEDFIKKPLSDEMLSLVQQNFDALREAGMKAVLRFAYSKSQRAAVFDAPENVVLNHIKQLEPLFEKNADVIAVMEAGFVGAWGEWYYSTHYGTKGKIDYKKRKTVLDAILKALPRERMVCLRTPLYKVNVLGITLFEPLSAPEAYGGSDKARLAHHNDCFLADKSDSGTFAGTADRAYAEADSKYTCMGGETCRLSTYTECASAIKAMETYHWSYLNADYHSAVINDWRQKGCYDEIRRRLGYRFVLKTAGHPVSAAPGGNMKLSLVILNEGFAAPYNPRTAEIIFKSKDKTVAYRHKMAADPRFWFSGKNEITENIILPPAMATGEYDVFLSLADSAGTLKNRPEYAIRLASVGVWDGETGLNKLFGQTIK